MKLAELSLFPLSAHILPGGRLSLRIFEPRYVRMVKQACQQGQGFGICMLNSKGNKDSNEHIYPVGTHVEIIDFDQLDSGLLGLTVQGINFFTISEVRSEEDGLRIAQCQIWEDPKPIEDEIDVTELGQRLNELFGKYPEFSNLYDSKSFQDPIWVMYRWMELLPISAAQKQFLIQSNNPNQIHHYLSDLIC